MKYSSFVPPQSTAGDSQSAIPFREVVQDMDDYLNPLLTQLNFSCMRWAYMSFLWLFFVWALVSRKAFSCFLGQEKLHIMFSKFTFRDLQHSFDCFHEGKWEKNKQNVLTLSFLTKLNSCTLKFPFLTIRNTNGMSKSITETCEASNTKISSSEAPLCILGSVEFVWHHLALSPVHRHLQ